MQHIFLSPHLDDAVLSCGGTLARLKRQSAAVTVVSIFAGRVENTEPLSPFAAAMHQLWGAPSDVIALRRAEDRAALQHFGLQPRWLSFKDAIYRGQPARGEWYYTDNAGLFGPVHPAERDLPRTVAAALRDFLRGENCFDAPATFYVPLAIGHHVDHQIVRAAAKFLVRPGDTVFFYEDYPYVQWNPADRDPAVRETAAQWGMTALREKSISLTGADVETKIAAIAEYQSQLAILFGGETDMREQVRTFTAGDEHPAEKFWEREDNS